MPQRMTILAGGRLAVCEVCVFLGCRLTDHTGGAGLILFPFPAIPAGRPAFFPPHPEGGGGTGAGGPRRESIDSDYTSFRAPAF